MAMLNHEFLLVIAILVAIIVRDAMCSPQLGGGRPNGFGRPSDATSVSPAYASDTSVPVSGSLPLTETPASSKGGEPNVYNGRLGGGFPGGFGRHDPHAPFATSMDPSASATSTPTPSSEPVNSDSTSIVTMSTTTTAPRANGGVLTATLTLGAPQTTGSTAANDSSTPLPHLPDQGLPLDTIGEGLGGFSNMIGSMSGKGGGKNGSTPAGNATHTKGNSGLGAIGNMLGG